MRRIVPILSLMVLVAACATNPTPETNLTPVSFEIYLIHESPAPDLVQRTVEATGETILLAKKPDLTASDIKWAKAQINPISGRPQVIVRFTQIGADKLAFLTRENLGRRLAIVVDGKPERAIAVGDAIVQEVSRKYLDLSLECMGFVNYDPVLDRSRRWPRRRHPRQWQSH